jgi:hypothetical protein
MSFSRTLIPLNTYKSMRNRNDSRITIGIKLIDLEAIFDFENANLNDGMYTIVSELLKNDKW